MGRRPLYACFLVNQQHTVRVFSFGFEAAAGRQNTSMCPSWCSAIRTLFSLTRSAKPWRCCWPSCDARHIACVVQKELKVRNMCSNTPDASGRLWCECVIHPTPKKVFIQKKCWHVLLGNRRNAPCRVHFLTVIRCIFNRVSFRGRPINNPRGPKTCFTRRGIFGVTCGRSKTCNRDPPQQQQLPLPSSDCSTCIWPTLKPQTLLLRLLRKAPASLMIRIRKWHRISWRRGPWMTSSPNIRVSWWGLVAPCLFARCFRPIGDRTRRYRLRSKWWPLVILVMVRSWLWKPATTKTFVRNSEIARLLWKIKLPNLTISGLWDGADEVSTSSIQFTKLLAKWFNFAIIT